MKLNNEQMLNSLMILSNVDEKGMLGYAIARNRQKIMAEVQEYSRKRDELLQEYGSDAGDGKFTLTAEAAAEFAKALKPFSDLEVDVQIMQVSTEVFTSGNLTSQQMFILDWMVKED